MPNRVIDQLTLEDLQLAIELGEVLGGYLNGKLANEKKLHGSTDKKAYEKLLGIMDKTRRIQNLKLSNEIQQKYPQAVYVSAHDHNYIREENRITGQVQGGDRLGTNLAVHRYWNDDAMEPLAQTVVEGLKELSEETANYIATLTDEKQIAFLNTLKWQCDQLAAGKSLARRQDLDSGLCYLNSVNATLNMPSMMALRVPQQDGTEEIELVGPEGVPLGDLTAKMNTGLVDAIITGGQIRETTDQILSHGPVWSAYTEATMRQKLQQQYEQLEQQLEQSIRVIPYQYDVLRPQNGEPILQNELTEYTTSTRGPKYMLQNTHAKVLALKAGWPVGDLGAVATFYQWKESLDEISKISTVSEDLRDEMRNTQGEINEIWEQMIAPGGVSPKRREELLTRAGTVLQTLGAHPNAVNNIDSTVQRIGPSGDYLLHAKNRPLTVAERELMAGNEPAMYYIDMNDGIAIGNFARDLAESLPDDHPQKQRFLELAEQFSSKMATAFQMAPLENEIPGMTKGLTVNYLTQDAAKQFLPIIRDIQSEAQNLRDATDKETEPLLYMIADRLELQSGAVLDGIHLSEIDQSLAKAGSHASRGFSDLTRATASDLQGKTLEEQKAFLKNVEEKAAKDPTVQLAQSGFDAQREAMNHVKKVRDSVREGNPTTDPDYTETAKKRAEDIEKKIEKVKEAVPKKADYLYVRAAFDREHPHFTSKTIENLYDPRGLPSMSVEAKEEKFWLEKGMGLQEIAAIHLIRSAMNNADKLEQELPEQDDRTPEMNRFLREKSRLMEALQPDPNADPPLLDELNRKGIRYEAYLMEQFSRMTDAAGAITPEGLNDLAKDRRNLTIESKEKVLSRIQGCGGFATVTQLQKEQAAQNLKRQEYLIGGYPVAMIYAKEHPEEAAANQLNTALVGSGLNNRSESYQKMAASAKKASESSEINSPDQLISYYEKMVADARAYERIHGGLSLKGIRPKGRARLRECRNVIRTGEAKLRQLRSAFEDIDRRDRQFPVAAHIADDPTMTRYQWQAFTEEQIQKIAQDAQKREEVREQQQIEREKNAAKAKQQKAPQAAQPVNEANQPEILPLQEGIPEHIIEQPDNGSGKKQIRLEGLGKAGGNGKQDDEEKKIDFQEEMSKRRNLEEQKNPPQGVLE